MPINKVRDLLPMLRTGKVVRGRLGVSVSRYAINENEAKDLGLSKPEGALIKDMDDSSPARAAGMKVGDVVVEFNGRPVKDSDELVSMVTHTDAGHDGADQSHSRPEVRDAQRQSRRARSRTGERATDRARGAVAPA